MAEGQQASMSFRLANLIRTESMQSSKISVFIKGDVNIIREQVSIHGGTFKFAAGEIVSAIIPVSALHAFSETPGIIRLEEGAVPVTEMNDKMLINNRIDLVHQGTAPLTRGYSGKGVTIGIIDSGIDFTHEDFLDSAGNTRVSWIWDHHLADSLNTPQPYNYGQEFSAADIDAGNATAHQDILAHGSHVAGIAAGNGNTNSIFTGAAPGANIIAVKIDDNQSTDDFLSSIADAVDYIYSKADQAGTPCVINISYGTYFGSHDGKDLETQAIDNLITSQNGRSLVAAAGNAGNIPIHIRHEPSTGDTLWTWFDNYSVVTPLFIEMWGDTADLSQMSFTIAADAKSPVVNLRDELPWTDISSNLGILKTDTMYSDLGNRLAIVQTYAQLAGDRYSMIYSIQPDSGHYYYRLRSTGPGKFDVYSFNLISSGIPNYYPYQTYVYPDFKQNLCSGFQCSDKVITTGQYVSRNNYIDVNGNTQSFPTTVGALGASSSRGPTRDGRIKPDIVSTGEVTLAPLITSAQPWFLANQPHKVAQGGKHIRDGGTSSAAPAVAGGIALLMEEDSTIDWLEIKNRIINCSIKDVFTGSNLPDNTWGYGKFNAMGLMTSCSFVSVPELYSDNLTVYPNPAGSYFIVKPAGDLNISSYRLINISGQEIELKISTATNEPVKFDVSSLSSGLYLLVATSNDQYIKPVRLIIE